MAANQLPSNSFTSNAVAVDPGIYSRIRGEASQSARGALINQARQISGVDTSTWMGPLQPINPFVPQGTGYRLIDYPVGVNIRFQPRQEGPIPLISFDELRFCSRNVDLIRIIIENRKQQLQRQNWQFTLKDGSLGEDDPRIAMLNKFFEMPDPLSDIDWSQWLNLIVEEMLVIDAPCVFLHRDKSGKPVAMRHIDGALIKCLIAADGASPLPPSPAYQQVVKGVPICDLDKTQLFYYPRNLRPDGLYGYSPVEGVINTLNLIMRRDIWRIQYYTSSNQPTGILEAPPNLTKDQVQDFQKMLNASLTGNTDQRWLLHFVPNGTKYTKLEQTPLTDELDQFVAQIICYQFGIPPTPFLMRMGMNRANAESAKDQSKEEGLAPLIAWMSNFVTRLVVAGWGWNDIKFGPIFSHESDPQIQSVVHKTYLSMAVYNINEVREDLGKDPIGPDGDVYRVYEATGATPLENVDTMSDTALETAQNGAKAALNPPAPVIAAPGTKIPGKANPNAPKGANTQANPPPKTTDGGKSAARAGTSKSPAKMKDSGGTSTKLDFSNVVLRPETIEKLEEKKRLPHFYKVGDLLIPSGLL